MDILHLFQSMISYIPLIIIGQSLCNLIYKIIANRVRPVFDKCVLEEQFGLCPIDRFWMQLELLRNAYIDLR